MNLSRILQYLMLFFFGIAFLVHIYVPLVQPSQESNFSHGIHLLSYSACGIAFLNKYSKSKQLYLIGMIYPFLYHLNCALTQWNEYGKFNLICWLVAGIMPLGLGLLFTIHSK